jgi:hypothetical protein
MSSPSHSRRSQPYPLIHPPLSPPLPSATPWPSSQATHPRRRHGPPLRSSTSLSSSSTCSLPQWRKRRPRPSRRQLGRTRIAALLLHCVCASTVLAPSPVRIHSHAAIDRRAEFATVRAAPGRRRPESQACCRQLGSQIVAMQILPSLPLALERSPPSLVSCLSPPAAREPSAPPSCVLPCRCREERPRGRERVRGKRRMQAGWPRQIWLARSDELRAGYRAEADIESIGLQFLVVFLFFTDTK